jgi:hypothetical protein
MARPDLHIWLHFFQLPSGHIFFFGRGFHYRPSSAARPPKNHGPASRHIFFSAQLPSAQLPSAQLVRIPPPPPPVLLLAVFLRAREPHFVFSANESSGRKRPLIGLGPARRHAPDWSASTTIISTGFAEMMFVVKHKAPHRRTTKVLRQQKLAVESKAVVSTEVAVSPRPCLGLLHKQGPRRARLRAAPLPHSHNALLATS